MTNLPPTLPTSKRLDGQRSGQSVLLNRILFNILLVMLAALAFIAGYLVHQHQNPPGFVVLSEAYGILRSVGLKPVPPDPALEYGMVRGMLQAYDDPYTTFLEPPQKELETYQLSGSYGGIGADVEQDGEGNWILYPFEGGPAANAGIHDGDRVLKADDTLIRPDTGQDTVLSALRGPVGKEVNLLVGRAPEWTPIPYTITFTEFTLPSVAVRIPGSEPRLGIIIVNLLTSDTAAEVEAAAKDLEARGATHFALDLRDNPGGLLDAGVNLARLFLKSGVVMEQRHRDQDVRSYKVDSSGPLADIPLVVFINRSSASAAEIAAGALQAHKRAVLIGEPSYGKDTIQLVYELQDGSSLHITSANWSIPGLGYDLADSGLQPDVQVEVKEENGWEDSFVQAAILEFFGRAQ